jgi:hypothetical protein
VLADSSIAFGLCSLVLVIGGVGFQIGRSNRPAPPPPMPHAAAAGPPHPGNAPAPNQAPPWQGHS